jgi:hypothetical protein
VASRRASSSTVLVGCRPGVGGCISSARLDSRCREVNQVAKLHKQLGGAAKVRHPDGHFSHCQAAHVSLCGTHHSTTKHQATNGAKVGWLSACTGAAGGET